MIATREVHTFDELLWKSEYSFAKRTECCTNAIVSSCLSTLSYFIYIIYLSYLLELLHL